MSDLRLRFSPAPTGFMHIGNAAHRAVQLVARAPHRRHVHPADRGHRRRPLDAGGGRADPERAALARARLGRRPVPPEPSLRRLSRGRAAPRRRRATRTSASAPRRKCAQRNEEAMRDGRPPGYDGRCRDLTAERARRARRRRPSALGSLPHARRRPQHVHRRRSAARSSVDWSTISDFVIVRSNGTPVFFLANARRRHRHGASRTCCAAKISSTPRTGCWRCGVRSVPTISPCTRTCR